MKRTFLASCFVLFAANQMQAQDWSASHSRDTSSFFPIGFYTFYICRGVPPFSYDPVTRYPPTRKDITSWVWRDSANIASIHANYFVDWIPHVYWHMVEPGPPIVHDKQPFEDDVFREFAVQNEFFLDYKNNNPWLPTPDWEPSVQEFVQYPPLARVPATAFEHKVWNLWKDSVRNELLRIRDSVTNNTVHTSPYHTFYAAHEVDIYPELRDNHGEITDAGCASRYALQSVCELWDDLNPDPTIKPFVVVNALDRWPHLLNEIAEQCPNLRMIAMDSYVIDPYVSTTHYPLSGGMVYRRGQKAVFNHLRNRMTMFWRAFKKNGESNNSDNRLPLERWFVGQVNKNYAVDGAGWALTGADFDWNNQNETREHQNGSALRYPTFTELRLQASLALSRGFKGILWYTYGSGNTQRPLRDFPFGVVDSLRRPITHDIDIGMKPDHPCSDLVNPFENVAQVNEELHRIAPIYRKLELVDVFSQDSIPDNCFKLEEVAATGIYGEEAIDISIFRRYDCDSCWYIMFVNKVLNDSYDPCHIAASKLVEVKFTNAQEFRLLSTDGLIEPTIMVVDTAVRCSFNLEPGQGRLFRIEGIDCSTFRTEYIPWQSSIAFYPNPITHSSIINVNLSRGGPVEIDVFNLVGKRIATVFTGSLSEGKHEIPVSFWPEMSAGIYFVRLQSLSGTVWTRGVVLR